MKNFYNLCYEKLKKVPKGKVITYKEIARALNSKAYRAVGTAMNKNPDSFLVNGKTPCHRVVNSDGRVGRFVWGTKKKIAMLSSEGVIVKNGKVDLIRFGFKF